MLGPDEHEEADAHQLLRGQQHVLVVPGDGLLQLSSPELLVRGAGREMNSTGWEQAKVSSSYVVTELHQGAEVKLEAVKQSQGEWCSKGSQQRHRLQAAMAPLLPTQPLQHCLTSPNTTHSSRSRAWLCCSYKPTLEEENLELF